MENKEKIQQIYSAIYKRRIDRQIERKKSVDGSYNQRWYDASVFTLQEALVDISHVCGENEELQPSELAMFRSPSTHEDNPYIPMSTNRIMDEEQSLTDHRQNMRHIYQRRKDTGRSSENYAEWLEYKLFEALNDLKQLRNEKMRELLNMATNTPAPTDDKEIE